MQTEISCNFKSRKMQKFTSEKNFGVNHLFVDLWPWHDQIRFPSSCIDGSSEILYLVAVLLLHSSHSFLLSEDESILNLTSQFSVLTAERRKRCILEHVFPLFQVEQLFILLFFGCFAFYFRILQCAGFLHDWLCCCCFYLGEKVER